MLCQFLLYSKMTQSYIYKHSFYHILFIFHHVLSQETGYRSLCCTAGPHCLSILNGIVVAAFLRHTFYFISLWNQSLSPALGIEKQITPSFTPIAPIFLNPRETWKYASSSWLRIFTQADKTSFGVYSTASRVLSTLNCPAALNIFIVNI